MSEVRAGMAVEQPPARAKEYAPGFIPQVMDIKPPQPMDVADPELLYDLIGYYRLIKFERLTR